MWSSRLTWGVRGAGPGAPVIPAETGALLDGGGTEDCTQETVIRQEFTLEADGRRRLSHSCSSGSLLRLTHSGGRTMVYLAKWGTTGQAMPRPRPVPLLLRALSARPALQSTSPSHGTRPGPALPGSGLSHNGHGARENPCPRLTNKDI